MFSYAQAAAVTDAQLAALSDMQRTALAMVLTPREDRLVDFRGENWSCFLGPMVSRQMQSHVESMMVTHMVSVIY